MTNEQLAALIKDGKTEYKPLLYEQVQKLLEMKSRDCYCKYFSRCIKCGIDLTDIYQECYFVFEEGLKAYKPESGYKFTSFLSYPFKNMFMRLLGYNNDNNTALNESLSLEQPINSDIDSDIILLLETIADTKATEFIEKIDRLSIAEQVREIINALPDRPKRVIIAYYIENRTLKDIAAELQISESRIQQIRTQAERTLKKSPQLQQLYNDFYKSHYNNRPYYYDWNPERFYLKKYNKPPEEYGKHQQKQYEQYNKWLDKVTREYYL